MGDALISTAYAVGNVVTSVALVLLNKRVFSGGFIYPMTLSCFHFAFTIVFYQLLAMANFFQKPAIDMPQWEKFKMAFAGFASIGFMNLSLTYNSVGFYQVSLAAAATCQLHAQPGEQERRQPPSHTHTPSHTTRPAQLLSSSRSSLQAEQSHGLSHGCASARRSRSSSSSP